MAESSKIIITSALPYANGPIHVGHLVEYIQTDIFVRFLKSSGKEVVYCCADDTHGTPIEIKASQLNIKPEELIAQIYREHTADFERFLIKFDNYYTTNSKENKYFSDLFFQRLMEKDLIYTKEIEVTFCEKDQRTLPDRYVKGKCPKCNAPDQYGDVCEACNATYKTVDLVDPYCILCKSRPVRKKSNHYFFRLSSFAGKLEEWLKTNKEIQSEIRNFSLSWIENGLEDWNISRDGPYFGFKIPGEENKYYYVWLDAPIGYIASFANFVGNNEKAEKEWNNSSVIHFIGKDITYFHLLFWPAMLMGAGFSLPQSVKVHGFLTVNGEKMSKSRGTFFTAAEFAEKYNPEYLRYYYASNLSKKLADIDLDFENFRDRVNNELVANLGNFCHRVLSFVNKNFDGTIKDMEDNAELKKNITDFSDNIAAHYGNLDFNEAVRGIMAISDMGNRYFQDRQPWKLIKEDRDLAQKICALAINIVKNLSILTFPILPSFSAKLQEQINVSDLTWNDINFELMDHKIGKENILMSKMEFEKEEKFPLNLKVGRILEVKVHPKADKLYVLQIDLGTEKRQLVAGLRGHYSEEQLLSKKIVMITNLKYAKLRGIESQGMLLAGDDGENVGVLAVSKAEPGTPVHPDKMKPSNESLTYEEFQKLSITVKNGKPFFEDQELMADSESITVEKVKDGAKVK